MRNKGETVGIIYISYFSISPSKTKVFPFLQEIRDLVLHTQPLPRIFQFLSPDNTMVADFFRDYLNGDQTVEMFLKATAFSTQDQAPNTSN